ncbi:hypothetical protein [Streptosporangium subroseum]|uniref:hypothetical protein n=1 Tax=Streptosporangium subroseum TaxID=106412 RepID=UPI003086DE97|nr:hypothetical protein OHB15_39650 [Streptosporangium subroseum]
METTVLRQLAQARGLLAYHQFRCAFEDEARKAGFSGLYIGQRQWKRWLVGDVRTRPYPAACEVLQRIFGRPAEELLALVSGTDDGPSAVVLAGLQSARLLDARADRFGGTDYDALRQELEDVLTVGTMSNTTLDDWEMAVRRYGLLARTRPAPLLLSDLGDDLDDLKRAMAQPRSLSTLRRLTRVAAHMSGLMCLTYIKLDDRTSFRRWARTARFAAEEAGDPVTTSWVLAQEAYGHFYSHDYLEAIHVCQATQEVRQPCAGAVLAAALEGRAHAALGPGRAAETKAALARAAHLLESLPQEDINDSAFGYNEPQLLFHTGNAYTHLGDTAAAWRAQEKALTLYPREDFLDRALIGLDRTICLAKEGDASGALEFAAATLVPLTEDQRQGLITLRGREVLEALPPAEKAVIAARHLHELLAANE